MDLAQVLLKAKQYPTALEFLKGAKDRFGTLPEYQYRLAWADYGLGNAAGAETDLKALVHAITTETETVSLDESYRGFGISSRSAPAA